MDQEKELFEPVVDEDPLDKVIISSLAKLDGVALGLAVGVVFGIAEFIATNILLIKGGQVIGPNLALLSQYFIGYEVTVAGSFVGAAYGLVSGFIAGWLIAFLRNVVVSIYVQILKVKGSMSAVNDYIDNP